MRAVIQIVSQASVLDRVGLPVSSIGSGIVALVGISTKDDDDCIDRFVEKLARARILPNGEKRWDRALDDGDAALLLVSNFTLCGDLSNGRRPSWSNAADGDTASSLFDRMVEGFRSRLKEVRLGAFGEEMEVVVHNVGPSTLVMES